MLLMLYLGGHSCFFFFNDTATTEIYTLSLHDALPILSRPVALNVPRHDAHQLRVGPRLPAVRLAGAPVPDLRIGCGARPLEELLEAIDGEVQVERVHVAHEHVELALELGAERRPVTLQVVAQVVVVRLDILGHGVVDISCLEIPTLRSIAGRAHRAVGRLPDRELLSGAGAAAEHGLELALL